MKIGETVRNFTLSVGVYPGTKVPSEFEFDFRQYRIIGSAFAVAPGAFMTNRHVIERVIEYTNNNHISLLAMQQPRTGVFTSWFGLPHVAFRKPELPEQLAREHPFIPDNDFGFFLSENDEIGHPCCKFANLDDLDLGADVVTSGYLYTDAFTRFPNFKGVRYGPILTRGSVSALNPYEGVPHRQICSYFVNASSGKGMSGGPVALSVSGDVAGIRYAGDAASDIAIVLPLDRRRVADLLLVATCAKYQLGTVLVSEGNLSGDLSAEARERLTVAYRKSSLALPWVDVDGGCLCA